MLPELPKDAETVASTRATAAGNPREVLSMLRSGLPLTAHETPAEAFPYDPRYGEPYFAM